MNDSNELTDPQIVSPVGINEQQTRAEVDIAISTARNFPRNIGEAADQMTSMATLTQDVAEGCFYVLPRGGKDLAGPSVRLAEIIATSWQHMRAATRIVDEGPTFVVVEGAAHDLQTNNMVSVQVRRRIQYKDGTRYNDDMINVTIMAAAAIAYRNAVLKCVPRTIWEGAYNAARQMAVGDIKTLEERRTKAMKYFTETLNIPEERVLARLGKGSVEEITLNSLGTLIGITSGIRNGEVSAEDAFADDQMPDAPARPPVAAKQKLQAPAAPAQAEEAPPPDAGPSEAEAEEKAEAEGPTDDVKDMAQRLREKAAKNTGELPLDDK